MKDIFPELRGCSCLNRPVFCLTGENSLKFFNGLSEISVSDLAMPLLVGFGGWKIEHSANVRWVCGNSS